MDEDLHLSNEDDILRLKTYLQKEQLSMLNYNEIGRDKKKR